MHYNGAISYLFVNGKEMVKFKAKDSEIVASPICLRNISKDWSADNMKKTGVNGYVYKTNVDYRYINASDIDKNMSIIHGYFNKMFQLIKKAFFLGLTILSSFTNASSLSCISMKIKNVKQDHKLLMLTVIIPYFILLVLKQVNVVAIVIILMIHMQKFVFPML